MEFIIKPFESLGPVKFGATVDEVRTVLNSPWESFRKNVAVDKTTDAFDQLGFHVYYNEANQCEAIECFASATLSFQGQRLIGRSYQELRDWFKLIDPQIIIDSGGLEARSFGIAIYAPNFHEIDRPTEIIEGAMIVDRGYFQRGDEMLAKLLA
jgi:hypothetical protein